MDDFASLDNYMGNPNPAAAGAASSRASTSRAISTAQGEHINQPRLRDRDVLRGVLDSTGQPETVETFEAQVKKFSKALADSETLAQREQAGYSLTRARLMLGHLRGEI